MDARAPRAQQEHGAVVLRETWRSTLLAVSPAPLVALLVMQPWAGPPDAFGRTSAPLVLLAAVVVVAVRRWSRVVLAPERLEVRRVLTRSWPWEDVTSVRQEQTVLGRFLVVRAAGDRVTVRMGASVADHDRISTEVSRAWRVHRGR